MTKKNCTCGTFTYFMKPTTAAKCPVCFGRGVVHADFYDIGKGGTAVNTSPVTCKSCNGRGVVWSE